MADQVETTGRTVEEAVKLALLKLGATLDEVDIKILDSGTHGRLLGLGSREARILVTRRTSPYREGPEREGSSDETPEPAMPEALAAEEETEEEFEEFEDDEAEPAGAPAATAEELAEAARELIQGVVDRMGFDAKVEKTGDSPLFFNVVGADQEELAGLIGPNGDNLRAFGFLINAMLGRMARRGVRVIVDVNGYRLAREDELNQLASRVADSVRQTREPVTLEAMPANERRLVHIALADDQDVRTYSIGEGRERRVVIGPKG